MRRQARTYAAARAVGAGVICRARDATGGRSTRSCLRAIVARHVHQDAVAQLEARLMVRCVAGCSGTRAVRGAGSQGECARSALNRPRCATSAFTSVDLPTLAARTPAADRAACAVRQVSPRDQEAHCAGLTR